MGDTFWLATTAAATIATAISTGVTLWLRQRDRPEVYWHIADRDSRKARGSEPASDFFALVNAGDGVAYRVEVTARPGEVLRYGGIDHPRLGEQIAIFPPGERLQLIVRHDGVPRDVMLRVAWIPEPTRVSKPVIEWIPLAEGLAAARSGRRSGPSDWRYRELRWWQVLQRHQQWASRRAKGRHWLATVEAHKEMQQWREQATERLQQDSAGD